MEVTVFRPSTLSILKAAAAMVAFSGGVAMAGWQASTMSLDLKAAIPSLSFAVTPVVQNDDDARPAAAHDGDKPAVGDADGEKPKGPRDGERPKRGPRDGVKPKGDG